MKTLSDLAADLAAFCGEGDLRRIRDMPEADFVMLLALHGVEQVWLAQFGQPTTQEGRA